MYICIYVYMCIYIYICMCVCIYIYIYMMLLKPVSSDNGFTWEICGEGSSSVVSC